MLWIELLSLVVVLDGLLIECLLGSGILGVLSLNRESSTSVGLDGGIVGLQVGSALQILSSLGGIVVDHTQTLVGKRYEVVGVLGQCIVEHLLGSSLVTRHRVHVVELLHHTVGLVLSIDILQLIDELH